MKFMPIDEKCLPDRVRDAFHAKSHWIFIATTEEAAAETAISILLAFIRSGRTPNEMVENVPLGSIDYLDNKIGPPINCVRVALVPKELCDIDVLNKVLGDKGVAMGHGIDVISFIESERDGKLVGSFMDSIVNGGGTFVVTANN